MKVKATAGSSQEPSTETLEHEIKSEPDIEGYLKKNKKYMLAQSLSGYLNTLLAQKGASRADVVRGSLLDRTYVYQIFSGKKTPSRDKLIAIAFGLGLSDDETQKMLKLSGNRELYARDERDAVILSALHWKKTIRETNEILYGHSMKPLGVPLD